MRRNQNFEILQICFARVVQWDTPTQRAPAEIVVLITTTSIFAKLKNAELSFNL